MAWRVHASTIGFLYSSIQPTQFPHHEREQAAAIVENSFRRLFLEPKIFRGNTHTHKRTHTAIWSATFRTLGMSQLPYAEAADLDGISRISTSTLQSCPRTYPLNSTTTYIIYNAKPRSSVGPVLSWKYPEGTVAYSSMTMASTKGCRKRKKNTITSTSIKICLTTRQQVD